MSDYGISKVSANDRRANEQIDALLLAEGIRRDGNLDYTCAMYDESMNIIATGSCFGNTLRCMAVSSSHQGEGLMNEIVTHLVEYQFAQCRTHIFLYTKCSSAKFFAGLGFYPIAEIPGNLVFMENKRSGFADYLKKLQQETARWAAGTDLARTVHPDTAAVTLQTAVSHPQSAAAIVMNANPFTLGHQYLVEQAAAAHDLVHLFVLSEDVSLVPFAVRKKLVQEGCAHLQNVCIHDSGPYIISSATFPSYFQRDSQAVIEGHARLDIHIFAAIAKMLGITVRYVGEEPNSLVTNLYNRLLQEELPAAGIQCRVIPRREHAQQAISASTVRQALQHGDLETLRQLVPESTWRYFSGPEAKDVIAGICAAADVVHY